MQFPHRRRDRSTNVPLNLIDYLARIRCALQAQGGRDSLQISSSIYTTSPNTPDISVTNLHCNTIVNKPNCSSTFVPCFALGFPFAPVQQILHTHIWADLDPIHSLFPSIENNSERPFTTRSLPSKRCQSPIQSSE